MLRYCILLKASCKGRGSRLAPAHRNSWGKEVICKPLRASLQHRILNRFLLSSHLCPCAGADKGEDVSRASMIRALIASSAQTHCFSPINTNDRMLRLGAHLPKEVTWKWNIVESSKT